MALPADIQTVIVTGTFLDPAGLGLSGYISFTPSVPLADPGNLAVIAPVARTYQITGGTFTSDPLAATDAGSLEPAGWTYTVQVTVKNTQPYAFSCFIPHAPDPVDISGLAPVIPVVGMGAYLPLSGGQMAGPLYAAGPPSLVAEVATKGYVDATAASLAAKTPVQEATTEALPANTATAQTLTANFTGALTVDGVTVSQGDRVLVKNEAAAANNGIYVATSAGSSVTPYVLTRSPDMDTGAQVPGAYAFVEGGTVNGGFGFIVAATGPYTLGTTAITWTKFSGSLSAGTGLTLSGSTVSLTVPVSVADGGTGSVTQNFADLTTNQNVAGIKTFTGEVIVPAPSSAADAATKAYVDGSAQGLQIKPAVNEATAAGLPAYTATSSTLTATSTGVLTVDGVTVALNDRVLVKNETSGNAPSNGIYTCTTAGALGAAYVLTRAADMDTGTEVPGAFVFVQAGTANATSGWACTTTGTVTLGTTPITFTQFSGAGQIAAGTGLSLSGTTISLNTPVALASGGTNATTAAGARTSLGLGAAALLATPIPVASGGTNATTAAAAAAALSVLPLSGGTVTGATTLPVTDSGGQVFNVRSFGAVGNGSANDTTAWQNAFAAAVAAGTSARGNGGTVLFPPGGHYMINQMDFSPAATARVAVSVVADGAIIEHNASAGGIFVNFAGVVSVSALEGCSLTGAMLYPKQSGTNPTTDLVYMTLAQHNVVDVRVFDPGMFASSSGSAIHIFGRSGQGCYYNSVSLRCYPQQGFTASYNGSGLTLDGWATAGPYIQSNTFPVTIVQRAAGIGINDLGSGVNVFTEADCEYNTGLGLVVNTNSQGLRFLNFYMEGNNTSGDQWSLPVGSANQGTSTFAGNLSVVPSDTERAYWAIYQDNAYGGFQTRSGTSYFYTGGTSVTYPRIYGVPNTTLLGVRELADSADRLSFNLDGSGSPNIMLRNSSTTGAVIALELTAAGAQPAAGPGSSCLWKPFGGEAWRYSVQTSASSPYTVQPFDRAVLGNAASGNVALTLASGQAADGTVHTFKKIDSSANTVTITPNAAATIDGAASYVLTAQWQYMSAMFNQAANNWCITGQGAG